MDEVIAVDIGGTKLATAVVNERGELRARREAPTPRTTSPQDADVLFDALAALVRSTHEDAPAALAVGVGCGGPMRRGGEAVSPLNIPGWRDFPLRARLAEHTGLDVWIDNDAKALALGEGWLGAAAGAPDYIAMVVSTGIGGGIVLDGRLLDGAGGNAGHVGHVIVVPDGNECGCGARGCVEAEASGTAIARITGGPPADAPRDVVTRAGTLVGRAVASVANLLDLPLAVVAGSVALGFGEPFFTAAQDEIDARCRLAFARATKIVPAGLRGDGPLVGAARVAFSRIGSG